MTILKTIEVYYMVYNLYFNKTVFEKGSQGKPRAKMTQEWGKRRGIGKRKSKGAKFPGHPAMCSLSGMTTWVCLDSLNFGLQVFKEIQTRVKKSTLNLSSSVSHIEIAIINLNQRKR